MQIASMKVSAFTYVRNGLKMGYPILESIRSVIDIVDEYVVVLGDSDDGSESEIRKIHPDKIRIIPTVWDMKLKADGKIFAQQSNIGLDHVDGDWILHLQADEVIHEKNLETLKQSFSRYRNIDEVEGLLFPFLNFRGDYQHIHTGRKTHRYEIRAFKKNSLIRSYRDSQGFRKFSSREAYEKGEKGEKLKVVKIDAPIYHYNYVRHPRKMKEKAELFYSFYVDDQQAKAHYQNVDEFDYNEVDKLEIFKGTHPAVMQETISQQDWTFKYDPSKQVTSLRVQILNKIEELTGYRIGEYKNYKLIRR